MPIHIGLGEYECDRCPKQFGSERAAYQHQNDTGHWLVECRMSDCRDSFLEEDSSDEHEKEDHLWCYDCDRYFQNYNNLNQVSKVSPSALHEMNRALALQQRISEFA